MRVGIIGTGLIGGSLGLALKASGKHRIFCWNRREEVSKKALKIKAVDGYFDSVGELAANSEIIIIATPLSSYPDICRKISGYLDGRKIISDVGSVKYRPVQKALIHIPPRYRSFFVPAHPIAGKEKEGIENADVNLFRGKRSIICKTANCKKGKKIAQVWKDAGAKIELINAEKHDEIYAYVSHYVQYLSHVVAKIFPNDGSEFSRLMNSPEDMWEEIFRFNSSNLKKVNAEYIRALAAAARDLRSGGFSNEYQQAAYVLAYVLDKTVPENYKKYAGSGYKSFTSPLLKANNKGAKTNASAVLKILNRVINGLKKAKF